MSKIDDILQREIRRTRPDRIVYSPRHFDGSTGDGLNEHFLVFDGPDGSLMATWTQSPAASGMPGSRQHNHIVFSRSDDEGTNWSRPIVIAGPGRESSSDYMASWQFPLVSKTGRIYVLYNRNVGIAGWLLMHTGGMGAVYSDDNGSSWSAPVEVPMRRSSYDDPSGKTPPEWIVWQMPLRDLDGNWFVGYSHWVHPSRAALAPNQVKGWTWWESVVEFMRFENVDADPEPGNLEIVHHAWDEDALRVPHYLRPGCSVAQEPSLVRLPDSRLLCVMRTCTGYIWWSQSLDDGTSWSACRPLLYRDKGPPLQNPVSCNPMYQLSDGSYIILYHNTTGLGEGMEHRPRNPLYLARGEFRPHAEQPVWFSQPLKLMDTEGIWVDRTNPDDGHRAQLAMYSSFTTRGGKNMLWYPDRKFFLLGKEISGGILDGRTVPA